METFWSLLVVIGAGLLIWVNIKLSDSPAQARVKRANAARERAAAQARVVCKFCHEPEHVTVRVVQRKKGISGGKATGALLTGGVSMLATGLSRKEPARQLSCTNCGMSWDEV